MPLRIAFDLDGTLADFESAFRRFAQDLSGSEEAKAGAAEPEAREAEERTLAAQRNPTPQERRRRLDDIWDAIEGTSDFWATLKPIEPDAVRRIRKMAEQHRWEIFFITRRPATAGETVQRQTQRWLIEQGFDMPSVIVLSGARGRLAAALQLDYLVDDSPKNGLDVIADSSARVLLVLRDPNETTDASARRLGLGIVRSIHEALDILDHATEATTHPTILAKLARLVGWRR
jgi:phosphoglycolate phosphatase-like HAD superfamily hydrolase